MISVLLLGLLFTASAYLTVTQASTRAFVWVFLPSTLLLLLIPPLNVPLLPDIDQGAACMYGVLVGLLIKGGERWGLRWTVIDTLMIALAATQVVTAVSTEKLWTGVSATGSLTLSWVLPYLLARVTFHDAVARRQALYVGATTMIAVGLIALVEMRLAPFAYSRLLEPLGIVSAQNTFVYHRFGLFRPQVGFQHPIDLGNAGVLMAAMLTLFAVTTGTRLTQPRVALGIAASLGLAAASLSFTSYAGLGAAMTAFAVLYYFPWTRQLIVPTILLAVLGVVLFTARLLAIDLERFEVEGGTFAASLWIRTLIVQNSWEFARDAGLFGFGKTIGQRDLDLASVDNSYMLFILRYGWLFLVGWISMVVLMGARAAQALSVARGDHERLPVIAAVAGICGTLAAMYTVWFGFAYSTLFIVLVGLGVSMFDVLRARLAPAVIGRPLPSRGPAMPLVRRPVGGLAR